MNLVSSKRSKRCLQHILLVVCVLCCCAASEPIHSNETFLETYEEPNMVTVVGKKKTQKSSKANGPKPKSSKNQAPRVPESPKKPTSKPTKVQGAPKIFTAKPTQAQIRVPTVAPTSNAACPQDNPYRTCYNGTSFVSAPPDLEDNELLVNGTVYVSTVMNITWEEFEQVRSCNYDSDVEEITLSWIQDNMKGNSSAPVCVYLNNISGAYHIFDYAGVILGVVYEMQMFFVSDVHTGNSFEQNLDSHSDQLEAACDTFNANAPNGKPCGREPRHPFSSTEGVDTANHSNLFQLADAQENFNGELKGKNFYVVLGNYTDVDPVYQSGAVLAYDGFDTFSVGACSILYYLGWSQNNYTFYCQMYEDYNCEVNGFTKYESFC